MTRKWTKSDTLVIATHNAGKLVEIRDILGDHVHICRSAKELDIGEPEETGATFEANAKLKAMHSALASGLPALADDSGLEVMALGGAPGIYSARWAGTSRDFKLAMTRVWEELQATKSSNLDARFVCSLCLGWPDGHCEIVEGYVEGQLTWPIRGEKGFGYDPMFIPRGFDVTFGEMDPAQKHAMSHRADAFEKLRKIVFSA